MWGEKQGGVQNMFFVWQTSQEKIEMIRFTKLDTKDING
jgi:hypothetical protein